MTEGCAAAGGSSLSSVGSVAVVPGLEPSPAAGDGDCHPPWAQHQQVCLMVKHSLGCVAVCCRPAFWAGCAAVWI